MQVIHINVPVQLSPSKTSSGELIINMSVNGGMAVRFKLVDDKFVELDDRDQDHG